MCSVCLCVKKKCQAVSENYVRKVGDRHFALNLG